MKNLIFIQIALLLPQILVCADDSPKPSLPSVISPLVSDTYQKAYLSKVFASLTSQVRRDGAFFSRDISQVYVAFLNDGPIKIMEKFPCLVDKANALQEKIFDCGQAPVSLLMHAAPNNNDLLFWETLHTSLRIALKHAVPEIAILSSDKKTMKANTTASLNDKKKESILVQPDFAAALIVIIRMLEFHHQKNAESFKAMCS